MSFIYKSYIYKSIVDYLNKSTEFPADAASDPISKEEGKIVKSPTKSLASFFESTLNNLNLINKEQPIQKEVKASKVDPSESTGKVITSVFKNAKGEEIAGEVVTRVGTVKVYMRGLEEKKGYLENLLLDPGLTPTQQEKIQKILERTNKQLEQVKDETATWASSNAPRMAFQLYPSENAREKLLPILGNLRVHQVITMGEYSKESLSSDYNDLYKFSKGEILGQERLEALNQKYGMPEHTLEEVLKSLQERVRAKSVISSLNRSAAVTDFSHGEISLEELKDYKELCEAAKRVGVPSIELVEKYELHKHRLDDVVTGIEKRMSEAYGHLDVDKIIEERRERLRSLVLQDLYAHFKQNPPDKPEVFYGRVGIVNAQRDPVVNKNGLVLNEKTQLLDGYAIFNEMDGVEVLFEKNLKGPFFDDQGRIHMPLREGQTTTSTKLSTIFLDVSVQRHTKNIGLQKFVNEKGIEKLKNLHKQGVISETTAEKLSDFERNVSNKKVSAFLRADMAVDLLSSLGYTGVHCFGGKDRTGYMMATATYRVLDQHIPEGIPEREKLLNKIARNLVSRKGVASQVAVDNIGHRVLKLGPYNLHLYRVKTVEGTAQRIYHYALLLETKKAGKGESTEQLYFKELLEMKKPSDDLSNEPLSQDDV